MYTNQTAFDKVCRWLLRPDFERCVNGNVCVYWREDGNRCAIGHLLTEATAKLARGQNCDTIDLCEKLPSAALELDGVDFQLLQNLQTVHDERPPYLFRDELSDIAAEYNLDTSVLDSL